jgi:hypothetical protein
VTKASRERVGCHVSAVAQAQRSATKRRSDHALKNWDPTSQPEWLTPETYATKIQPRLAQMRPADIMNVLGVSWLYASYIRRGIKRPHPRHWVKLAELAGGRAGIDFRRKHGEVAVGTARARDQFRIKRS